MKYFFTILFLVISISIADKSDIFKKLTALPGIEMTEKNYRGLIDLKLGNSMVIESIIGTEFTGKVAELTRFGVSDAVIPEVQGEAFITGKNTFIIDPDDPLKEGSILR